MKDRIFRILKIAVPSLLVVLGLTVAIVYNSFITSENEAEIDSYLKALSVEGYSFMPVFDPNLFTYELYLHDYKDSLNITAIPRENASGVKVRGNKGFTEGYNRISVEVTAEAGNSRVYEIIVYYEPSNIITPNMLGNSNRNLMNNGKAASQGDFIYYTDGSGALFRETVSGSSKAKLSSDECSCLNVVGDWVYYIYDYGIYRVKTDGSVKQNLTDIFARYMVVSDNYIYYANALPDNNGYLKKIPVEAFDNEYHPDLEEDDEYPYRRIDINSSVTEKFAVVDNIIYFINESEEFLLYSVSTDGGEDERITDISVKQFVQDSQENAVYFTSRENGKLYRQDLESGELRTVINNNVVSFTIDGNYILYSTNSGSTYIMNKDGSGKKSFMDTVCSDFSVINSYIYFTEANDEEGIYTYRVHRNYTGRIYIPDPVVAAE